MQESGLSSKRLIDFLIIATNEQVNKRNKKSSKYITSYLGRSNLAIEFYFYPHSELFLPVANNNNSYQPEHLLQHASNINNMHLLNPPGDGDCLFHIITQLAILHGWNDVPSDQL